MKSRFLVFKNIADPEEGLRIADQAEWTGIMQENYKLPYEKRRFFIEDDIYEGKERDRIYIETTKDEYDKWHTQQMRKVRKAATSQKFMEISGDIIVTSDGSCVFDTIFDLSQSPEEIIQARIRLEQLQGLLSSWKYWAPLMLDIYLAGEGGQVIKLVSEVYGVDQKTVRKWRAAFKTFVKDFYNKNQ